MKGRLFNILSALSLVLFVALGVLCVRSHWFDDAVRYDRVNSTFAAESDFGRLMLVSFFTNRPSSMPTGLHYRTTIIALRLKGDTAIERWGFRSSAFSRRWGFGYYVSYGPFSVIRSILIPHWVFMVAAAILPTVWLGQEWKKLRRIRHGLCLTCGYDLRASKERCPECGTAIPSDSASGCETEAI